MTIKKTDKKLLFIDDEFFCPCRSQGKKIWEFQIVKNLIQQLLSKESSSWCLSHSKRKKKLNFFRKK
jgi:hypothetical protein